VTFRSSESMVDMLASSFHEVPAHRDGDGKSGGSKPLRAGGRISLSGLVLAALPTQVSRRLRLQMRRHKKPTGLTEVGTALRGVSTLLVVESPTVLEESQGKRDSLWDEAT